MKGCEDEAIGCQLGDPDEAGAIVRANRPSSGALHGYRLLSSRPLVPGKVRPCSAPSYPRRAIAARASTPRRRTSRARKPSPKLTRHAEAVLEVDVVRCLVLGEDGLEQLARVGLSGEEELLVCARRRSARGRSRKRAGRTRGRHPAALRLFMRRDLAGHDEAHLRSFRTGVNERGLC